MTEEKNHGLIVWVYNCFLATVENLVTLIQSGNVSYSVVQCYQITMGGLLHTMSRLETLLRARNILPAHTSTRFCILAAQNPLDP